MQVNPREGLVVAQFELFDVASSRAEPHFRRSEGSCAGYMEWLHARSLAPLEKTRGFGMTQEIENSN
jgi:hypothetical protein